MLVTAEEAALSGAQSCLAEGAGRCGGAGVAGLPEPRILAGMNGNQ